MKKSSVYTVFFLMLILLLAATFFSRGLRQNEQPFDIGDYSGADRTEAEKVFLGSSSNDDLAELLKILCYQYKIEGDGSALPLIRSYGQELLDRAKAGTADLEKMNENGVMLQILSVIRGTGAK